MRSITRLPVRHDPEKLWPFGRTAIDDPTATPLGIVGAILWIIPGLIMAVGYVISGALLCLTIIGIPFGIQSFKLAGLALAPFGKEIVRLDELPGYVPPSTTAA